MNNKNSKAQIIIISLAIIAAIITMLSGIFYWYNNASKMKAEQVVNHHNDPTTPIVAKPIASTPTNESVIDPDTKALSRPPRDEDKVDIDYSRVSNQNRQSALGINTNEIYAEDSSLPFVDLFKMAAPFQEKETCPSDQPKECLSDKGIIYNKRGWPIDLSGGKAGTKFLGQIPKAALPKGNYIVLYDGSGTLAYGHDVAVVKQSAGRDIINFSNDTDGIIDASLLITATERDDPIRNISVLMPGGICQNNPFQPVLDKSECHNAPYLSYEHYSRSIIFNPDYLTFMKDFSVIRFMPMSGITRNSEKHWHERPSWKEPSWGGTYGKRGAPLEVMLALANRLNADTWFNMPHEATNEYIKQYAKMVKAQLKPNLNIYLEYTNEAWNTNFIHAEYTQKKGIELGLDSNAIEAGYKYYTQRSREVYAIWEGIFKDKKRIIRVLGGWDTRSDITQKLLSYKDAYKDIDVLAIAPYVGGNTKGFRATKNLSLNEAVDQVFHLLTDKSSYRSLPEMLEHIEAQATISRKFGVRLVAYEGGQGLVDWATRSPDQHPNPVFFAANRDDRMKSLYKDLLDGWRHAGGDLFVAFSAPRTCQWYGCWGLKEHIKMPRKKSPKYDAVLNFIENNPLWWNKTARKEKPNSHIVPQNKKVDPAKPRIVIRPAKGHYSNFHRLENPRTLDVMVQGEGWDKKDSSGKWQAKWDTDNLYLTIKAYDDDVRRALGKGLGDSVELFIDADNSRYAQFDGKNDFHFIFNWQQEAIIQGQYNPANTRTSDITVKWIRSEDGYELHATIPWSLLNVQAKIAGRIGVEIQINDYDKGDEKSSKIAWISNNTVINNPQAFGVVLISGR